MAPFDETIPVTETDRHCRRSETQTLQSVPSSPKMHPRRESRRCIQSLYVPDEVSDCAPGQLGAPLAMAVAQRMSTVGATKKFGTRFAKKKPAPKKKG